MHVFRAHVGGEDAGSPAGNAIGFRCGQVNPCVGEECAGTSPECGCGFLPPGHEDLGLRRLGVMIDCVMQERSAKRSPVFWFLVRRRALNNAVPTTVGEASKRFDVYTIKLTRGVFLMSVFPLVANHEHCGLAPAG